jgi:hypothetical protein
MPEFNGLKIVVLFFILFGGASLYILPSAIAYSRYHKKFIAIFLLNLFFGVTVIGWLMAFFWSWTNPKRKQEEDKEQERVRQRIKEICREEAA